MHFCGGWIDKHYKAINFFSEVCQISFVNFLFFPKLLPVAFNFFKRIFHNSHSIFKNASEIMENGEGYQGKHCKYAI